MPYYLHITSPQLGDTLLLRPLEDHESMDVDEHADWFARDAYGAELSHDGVVPCDGELKVQITEDPNTGYCWDSKHYFFK